MNELIIANVLISQNINGLYSLNDLHKSHLTPNKKGQLVIDPNKTPAQWLRADRKRKLVRALEGGAHMCELLDTIVSDDSGVFGNKYVLLTYAQYLSAHVEIAVKDALIYMQRQSPGEFIMKGEDS